MPSKWIAISILFFILGNIGVLGNYAWQVWKLRQQSIATEQSYQKAKLIHQKIIHLKQKVKHSRKRAVLTGTQFSEHVLKLSRRFGLSLVSFQVLSASDYQGIWVGTLKQWKNFLSQGVLDMDSAKIMSGVQCPTNNCFTFEAVIAKDDRRNV